MFKKILISIFALAALTSHASDVMKEFEAGGPYKVFEVVADATPTPYMTGYVPETKECHLLINKSVKEPEGLAKTVALAHEAGHCVALRNDLQKIDGGVTRYGEAFGDIYALAWISKNQPADLDAALNFIWQERSLNRQFDNAYNTLFVVRMARNQLPTTKSVFAFTKEILSN